MSERGEGRASAGEPAELARASRPGRGATGVGGRSPLDKQ